MSLGQYRSIQAFRSISLNSTIANRLFFTPRYNSQGHFTQCTRPVPTTRITMDLGTVNLENGSNKDAVESPGELEQHCLLFPTYATRHSRSGMTLNHVSYLRISAPSSMTLTCVAYHLIPQLGSKDPLDWNIRVRGWAFSKRSTRRKRIAMSKVTLIRIALGRFVVPSNNAPREKDRLTPCNCCGH